MSQSAGRWQVGGIGWDMLIHATCSPYALSLVSCFFDPASADLFPYHCFPPAFLTHCAVSTLYLLTKLPTCHPMHLLPFQACMQAHTIYCLNLAVPSLDFPFELQISIMEDCSWTVYTSCCYLPLDIWKSVYLQLWIFTYKSCWRAGQLIGVPYSLWSIPSATPYWLPELWCIHW